MTVKCVEMLKQQCSKQLDKNGSDLPEGIILLINSIASMQSVEADCCMTNKW